VRAVTFVVVCDLMGGVEYGELGEDASDDICARPHAKTQAGGKRSLYMPFMYTSIAAEKAAKPAHPNAAAPGPERKPMAPPAKQPADVACVVCGGAISRKSVSRCTAVTHASICECTHICPTVTNTCEQRSSFNTLVRTTRQHDNTTTRQHDRTTGRILVPQKSATSSATTRRMKRRHKRCGYRASRGNLQ
jgi:hypothetical protein